MLVCQFTYRFPTIREKTAHCYFEEWRILSSTLNYQVEVYFEVIAFIWENIFYAELRFVGVLVAYELIGC
ncbi:hypothetical protein SAMN05878276_0389 [Aquipseudomonas alcaligenes]|nr:hypothetical protein SAMN05878276_0389 [Pseudomonas alcaligenes]